LKRFLKRQKKAAKNEAGYFRGSERAEAAKTTP
jgi:hypothetical protein